MRHAGLVVLVVVLLVAGLVPAQALPIPLGSGSAVSFLISMETKFEAPAGRITIWFTDREGNPRYDFTGNPQGGFVRLPGDDPMIAVCYAKIDLTGKYADQQVESSWTPIRGETNMFARRVTKEGPQEAKFWFKGKEKNFLKILWASIGIGSKTVTIEESFRLLVQGSVGLTTYHGQLELAARDWPSLSTDDHELWARTYEEEHWYLAQGLMPRGTEERPLADTSTLSRVFTGRQADADAARVNADANARALAEAETTAAAKANAEADANAEAARIAAEAAKSVNWTLLLPQGKAVVEISTVDALGNQVTKKAGDGLCWMESVCFTNLPSGSTRIELGYADGTNSAWRTVEISAGLIAQFEEVR